MFAGIQFYTWAKKDDVEQGFVAEETTRWQRIAGYSCDCGITMEIQQIDDRYFT